MEERKKAQAKGLKLLPFRLITTLKGKPNVAAENDVDSKSDHGQDTNTDGCLASGSQQSSSVIAQEPLAASVNEGNSHEITSQRKESNCPKSDDNDLDSDGRLADTNFCCIFHHCHRHFPIPLFGLLRYSSLAFFSSLAPGITIFYLRLHRENTFVK
jgi:hypothetical protein